MRDNRALAAILDSLSAYVFTLDCRGRVSYASRSWLKFAHENRVAWLQIEPEADYLAVCRSAAQQGDPLAQQVLEGIEAVLAGRLDKMSLEYPFQGPGPMGRQRWFLMNVDPLAAEHGGVVISHIDITEHKQMETALAERDAKFRGIYHSNIVPIAFWNCDGCITNANDAYLRLIGYSRSELEEGKLRLPGAYSSGATASRQASHPGGQDQGSLHSLREGLPAARRAAHTCSHRRRYASRYARPWCRLCHGSQRTQEGGRSGEALRFACGK